MNNYRFKFKSFCILFLFLGMFVSATAQEYWIEGFYERHAEGDYTLKDVHTKGITIDGKTEFPFTTGKNQYDFIDYDEFCNQIANVTINNEVLGIINCCSGVPESLASRVERFIKENQYKIKLNYGAFPDRPYDSLAVWGDDSKIKKILEENKAK